MKFHQDSGFLNPTAGILNFVLFAATLPVSAPAYLLIPPDADLNASESSERTASGEAHRLKTKLANSEND